MLTLRSGYSLLIASLAIFRRAFRSTSSKPISIGLARRRAERLSEQFAFFENFALEPDGLRYAAEFVSPEAERKLISRIQDLPLEPFEFGSRESDEWLRSDSAMTMRPASCGDPSRYQLGCTESSRRSKHSMAPILISSRSFALNTVLGSASAGIATTSNVYSAFRWVLHASSGFANPPANHGIASRSMPNLARYT
jgi:hypothetical protein